MRHALKYCMVYLPKGRDKCGFDRREADLIYSASIWAMAMAHS